MAVYLPIDQVSAWFQFATELEGATYGFVFRWNGRQGAWIMDVLDGESQLRAAGIKVAVGLPLFFATRNLDGLPPGELVAIDTQGSNEDPDFGDLGRRTQLVYLTAAEMAVG